MPFSAEARRELASLVPTSACCRRAQLLALVQTAGRFAPISDPRRLVIRTGSPGVARSVYLLLRGLYRAEPELQRTHRRVRVMVALAPGTPLWREMWEQTSFPAVPWRRCCRRAYLRGAFLAGGSIAEPGKAYHLEVDVASRRAAAAVLACAESFGLSARTAPRKQRRVIYFKESAQIVDFLNLIGAHAALLNLENIRIVKDVRNQVNRQVNCETANVDKTVRAALAQIEKIQTIAGALGLGALPPALADLARARLAHPYASLKELGEALTPPASKSAVSYRMNRLLRIVERLGRRELLERRSPGEGE